MKFIIVRHFTTAWNMAGRMQGHKRTGLGKESRQEARKLYPLIKDLGISKIISSDLRRSRETAFLLQRELHVPVFLEKRFRQCSFGSLEGLKREEAIKKYGLAIAKNWDDRYRAYDFRQFGGEDRNSVFARHLEALSYYARQTDRGSILLIGHGRSLCTLLRGLGYDKEPGRGDYLVIEFKPTPKTSTKCYTHRAMVRAGYVI